MIYILKGNKRSYVRIIVKTTLVFVNLAMFISEGFWPIMANIGKFVNTIKRVSHW